ncbi:MAG TPA: electron transfer flavoprotein subunit beta, partial [Acidobacteriota bacterium]|nr:electron transfer flavoprotein subunit beta [Acidobacteriota bacterium]
MNIHVFVKRVPDTESRIRIDRDAKAVVEDGLNFVISPYDEYAVEEALRLREAHGGAVRVFAAGREESLVVLKKCVAMGADEAVLV